jgi:SET domain-containing protein
LNIPRIDPSVSRFGLRVKRSDLDRWGVFALEGIPAGRRVIEYGGERLTYRQARTRFAKTWKPRGTKRFYFAKLDDQWVIDGAVGGTGAELINHSCEPNLSIRPIRGHIFYFSRRAIRRGEELTVDYKFSKTSPRVTCRCGSRTCRGTINVS